jgi:predicted DsbA family dithiol-disulfide isomerase
MAMQEGGIDSSHIRRRGGPPEPASRPKVEPGTIMIYSDLSCAFAHLCVHRLHEARDRLGAEVRFVHRPYLIDELDDFPIPRHFVDLDGPLPAGLDLDGGWEVWSSMPDRWPISTQLAMEAVRAAELQGIVAHEQLDRALRRAFFEEHRSITLRGVILDVAEACQAVDVDELVATLDAGRVRAAFMADLHQGLRFVKGSPHLFFADGYAVYNPGVSVSWFGRPGESYPTVELSDPGIHAALIERAAAASPLHLHAETG